MTPTAQVEGIGLARDDGTLFLDDEQEPVAHHSHLGPPSAADGFQPVLSIRARVDGTDVPSFIRDALREIRTYIEEQHVEVEGPPFSICDPAPLHDIDVEVGWPVHRAPGAGRIACRELPTGLVRRGWGHT
jgi:hypothetical protein